jgi:hypothetical protein
MFPKCVETIYHPSLWDEEIVHPLEKSWDKVHHQYNPWDGYRQRHPSEPSEGYRCGSHPDWCRDEHRKCQEIMHFVRAIAQELVGLGDNISPSPSFYGVF